MFKSVVEKGMNMKALSDRLGATHYAVLTLLAGFIGTTVVIMVVMAGLVVHASGGPRLLFPWLSMLYAVPVVAVLVRAGLGAEPPEEIPPTPDDAWIWGLLGWTVIISSGGVRTLGVPSRPAVRGRVLSAVPQDREDLVRVLRDRRTIVYGIAVATQAYLQTQ